MFAHRPAAVRSRRALLAAGPALLALGAAHLPAARAQGTGAARPLRVLLLNPNSSDAFTELITREARKAGSTGTEFVGVTAPLGPRYIGTRTSSAVAGHAVVDGLARTLAKDRNFDAAIVCGFGAQGAPALREFAPFPVVDMLEASVAAALQLGMRYSVLTGGANWVPMLRDILQGLGFGQRLASVRSIPLTGAEIAADQERAIGALTELSERCVKEDGADCVILGGAAVAGLPRRMADRVSVPLVDNVAVAVATAELLARQVVLPKRQGGYPSIESSGLSEPLDKVLKQN
jgi:allantoin racemase